MAKPARVKKKQSQAGAAGKAEKPDAKSAAKAKVKDDKQAAASQAKAQKPKAKEVKAAKAAAETKGIRGRVSRTPAKQAGKAAATAKEKRSLVKFLREVRVEMSKVTWPSREELIQSTIVVLIAVAIAGIYIAIFDAIFSRLISFLS